MRYPIVLVCFIMGLIITNDLSAQEILIPQDSILDLRYDYEYIPDASYDEIASRLSSLGTTIPLNFNPQVKAFVDYFTVKDREYTKVVMKRSFYYFPIFEKILAEYGMPDELKYLAVVESGLVAHARSRAAAVGPWQFISSTGRHYGLNTGWYIDDRMDPWKSTEAACKFIRSLYNQFGDWELALAAYNCGPGNVRKAIKRSGYQKSFWEIYKFLPRETRSYVPQFVAVTYAFKYAEEHNLMFEPSEVMSPVEYAEIEVDGFKNLHSLAEQLDLCVEELTFLNSSVRQLAVPSEVKNFKLRIPLHGYELLAMNMQQILDSASVANKELIEYQARSTPGSTYGRQKVQHVVSSGEVLGSISQMYNVRIADLRDWNNLHGNLIRVGQRLDVWVKPAYVASATSGQKALPKPSPIPANDDTQLVLNGNIKYHVVQPGDTLWDISKAYQDLTVEKIKKLNNLKDNKIKPGQRLVIG